ncbi:MAG: class I SAM-dependent methyltransferase [Acidobacteria bacterium]|nr:class I SAM-dependent methyltransferase [Acidobacteriota bacterium]
MAIDLGRAILDHQAVFGLELTAPQIDRLHEYYEIVQEQNPVLHLVAPCSAEEFAVRHILESLTLLKHLPNGSKLADVGAGAGLPSIPCLLVRDDISARLIDSKERKARFLGEAVERLGLGDRAEVISKQFIETHAADATHVTCRALDKFVELVPRLIRWSKDRTMLLFGGPTIGEALERNRIRFAQELMPLSERRYLYVIKRGSDA